MHEPTPSLNPFDGQPGLWNKVNRFVYRFAGPAQVGIGRPEAAYVPEPDPRCPLCSRLMSDHNIQRGTPTTPTYLNCPA